MDYARIRAVAEKLARHAPDDVRGFEIAADGIVVLLPQSRPHEFMAFAVREQLAQQLSPELVAHNGGEIEDPSLGRLRRPDAVVVPRTVFAAPTMAPFAPQDIPLVVEIVSPSNHSNDYVEKVQDYSAMGIEHYLVVDPRKGTVTVFTDPGPGPEGPRYRAQHDYAFGDDVTVGPWVLATADLHTYPASG